jgi:hypothetical protein
VASVRLKDDSGNEFQLVILSYQHPDVHEDRWESNWLLVSGSVATAAGQKWKFSAPCVTTFELAELADWLDDLSKNGRSPGQFEFAEPHVRFGYVPWPKPALQLTLSGEAGPPANAAEEQKPEVTLEFGLSAADPTALAAQIRDALSDFPIRGGAA